MLHSSLLLSFPLLSYPIANLCSFLPLSHIQSQSKQLFGLSALQRPTGSPTAQQPERAEAGASKEELIGSSRSEQILSALRWPTEDLSAFY